MPCCSVKTLSYISASVQLIFCIFLFVFLLTASIISLVDKEREENEYDDEERRNETTVIVVLIICFIGTALLITLIVGIKQKRLPLVRIYVYMYSVLLVVAVLAEIINFVQYIVHIGLSTKEVLTSLLEIAVVVGVEIIFFVPICIYYKRLSATPILPTSYNPPVVKMNREF